MLPSWAKTPIDRFRDYVRDAMRLLELSQRGLFQISKSEAMFSALINLEKGSGTTPEQDAESEKTLARARDDAVFAQKEISSGFPFFNSQALVGAWGALEATIEDLQVGMLLNDTRLLELDTIGRIRLRLSEFIRLGEEDRARLLVYELQKGS